MKILSTIAVSVFVLAANAQTIPAPPYYQTPSPAYGSSVGNPTPMVKSPVENNNPSVQASIPILNKPSGLEADQGGYTAGATNRIIYNNSQQNTPVKNVATEGTASGPTVIAAASVSSDTAVRTMPGSTDIAAASTVVKTTVIYNNTIGTDVTRTVDKTSQTSSRSNNSVPVKHTYISEAVVNRFKMTYGDNLYDIRQVRYGNNNTTYIVRTMKDGLVTTVYLNEDGEIVRQ